MTNEEVMRAFGIHTYSPAYDRGAEATVEFLKDTIELVNGIRQNKYKWHDLRKNPEDLPTDNHQVLVAWSGMKICDIAVYGSDNKLWGTFTASYKTGEVIAWREIEPFEEEE